VRGQDIYTRLHAVCQVEPHRHDRQSTSSLLYTLSDKRKPCQVYRRAYGNMHPHVATTLRNTGAVVQAQVGTQ
jgi:hypothetical protein